MEVRSSRIPSVNTALYGGQIIVYYSSQYNTTSSSCIPSVNNVPYGGQIVHSASPFWSGYCSTFFFFSVKEILEVCTFICSFVYNYQYGIILEQMELFSLYNYNYQHEILLEQMELLSLYVTLSMESYLNRWSYLIGI